MKYTRIANRGEIPDGEVKVVQVNHREIAVFHLGGEFFALSNICPHRGGPIAEGEIKGATVTCPWHEWSFEIRTGKCTLNPAAYLERFDVKLERDDLLVSHQPVEE